MPRRTGEETKTLLIDTGMKMLLDRGISAGVSHIRLQEVVRRAGLTTGAAYRLWADQDEFHHDLAVALARHRQDRPVAATWAAIGQSIGPGSTLDEVIRLASAAHVRGFGGENGSGSRLFLIALALRATAHTWPDLRQASSDRHTDSITEFVGLYRQLMQTYGYRMRTPYTIEHFTVAMAALGEGFALHSLEGLDHPLLAISPDSNPDQDGPTGEWTLFGLAARALVDGFMIRVAD